MRLLPFLGARGEQANPKGGQAGATAHHLDAERRRQRPPASGIVADGAAWPTFFDGLYRRR
jgi:hypothetical protein